MGDNFYDFLCGIWSGSTRLLPIQQFLDTTIGIKLELLFVYVEVLQPCQPDGVISSMVS